MEKNRATSETILQTALHTVQSIDANSEAKSKLEELTHKVTMLEELIYKYTLIEQDGISSDDEILNYTIPVVVDELNAAIWNLVSGCYKTSATCLRGALEMGIVALYFQVLEDETGSDQAYSDWDSGASATPSWHEIEPVLKRHMNAKDFSIGFGYCPIQELGLYLQLLNRFAHNSSFSSIIGEGTNIMSMKSGASGQFSQEMFDKIYGAVETTISIIASTWITIYPQIMPELEGKLADTVKSLFVIEPAQDAFEFASDKIL